MNAMKRIVYHFDGKDYSSFQRVYLTFKIQETSIQNVLELAKSHYVRVKSFKRELISEYPQMLKCFELYCFAEDMYKFLESIGFKESSEVYDNVIIRHHKFRMPSRKGRRYNGISCYNPKLHTWELKSNSPEKIVGKQSIINGKLWRKYYQAKPGHSGC